jgi:SNF2 family DNA or RNA helicase
MLDYLEPSLKESEIPYVRFDGSMPRKKRDAAIEEFQFNPNCRVFCSSLKAAAFGLNLTSANLVFLLDSWW